MSINSLAVESALDVRAAFVQQPQSDVVAALTKYIPTESITLYIATVAAQVALTSVVPWMTPRFTYWAIVAGTPLLMLLLHLRAKAINGGDWKTHPAEWPWWPMIASTIAFAVWAMAVPGNPIVDTGSGTGGAVAALAAVFVSTSLNLVSPFFPTSKS
jgi:hypothetical protein